MPWRGGRFFGKLFWCHVLLVAVILVVSLTIIVREFGALREHELTDHLTAYARALVPAVRERFDHTHAADLDALALEVGSSDASGVRVTFVLLDGTVVGDSQADAPALESHARRPEIVEALAQGVGISTRWSTTVLRRLRYVAVRVERGGQALGVVRVAMPVTAIVASLRPLRELALVIALTGILAAILLALGLATLWSGRIARVTAAARSLARGDLSARVVVSGRDEVSRLARSLNRMRDRLASHLGTIDCQRRTLQLLVNRLAEGVIVVDVGGRLVLVNPAARRLLRVDPPDAGDGPRTSDTDDAGDPFVGAPVEQYIAQPALLDLVRPGAERTSADAQNDLNITLDTSAGALSLRVRAGDIELPTPETPEGGEAPDVGVGRLVVFTDVTELTKVAQMRTDFAANASHELRTPLSAIRAAVETMRSVAASPDAASGRRFLDVIDRQRRRMEAMVRDLLDLARVEAPGAKFQPSPLSSAEVLGELHAAFAESLSNKSLALESSVDEACATVVANPDLLHIVLRNLVENAIKFTDPGGTIRVSVRREPRSIAIEVSDEGCGIPESEQARVFERFYQVRRDRSGADRGTGLGLSIVRNAVVAMNGEVRLVSEIGKGTSVTTRIPCSQCWA